MEELMKQGIDAVILGVESAGAAIVAVGAVIALVQLVRGWLRRDDRWLAHGRVSLGRHLAFGLEFQLAGDILKTAVSPTWDTIGRLAAIAAIRTALNYFLAKEIEQEQRALASAATPEGGPAHPVAARAAAPAPAVAAAVRPAADPERTA